MDINTLKSTFKTQLETALNSEQLNDLRIEFFGKKGLITGLMQSMKEMSQDDRIAFGKDINVLKEELTCLLDAKMNEVKKIELNNKLLTEKIDVTVPGFFVEVGTRHPLTMMSEYICNVFQSLGFEVEDGPEVETDVYNFEMLNIPKNHPARAMQDTFYINEEYLLRTHTSPVQIRKMLKSVNEPIRILCPGKVFRRDEDDATHSHQFMQIEGLLIDEGISMAHLKGTLEVLAKSIFGEDRQIRLRPSYFPFTEPSVEVDIDCFHCKGKGCSLCKQTGYIEVLGAGMVHPNVLEAVGYDTTRFSGFAFGLGVERFVMLKYGVEDIRDFYQNDERFLKQFAISNGGDL